MQHASKPGDSTARQLRSADRSGLGRAAQREWLALGPYASADWREATRAVARFPQAGRQTRDDAGGASWSAADLRQPIEDKERMVHDSLPVGPRMEDEPDHALQFVDPREASLTNKSKHAARKPRLLERYQNRMGRADFKRRSMTIRVARSSGRRGRVAARQGEPLDTAAGRANAGFAMKHFVTYWAFVTLLKRVCPPLFRFSPIDGTPAQRSPCARMRRRIPFFR
ncbi:hypothetical protein [Burkholderia cenocepacia]|uniref:hypothetical protein n=1 Tax=Burkholderia cepacia complex TaxID=87882 RepID=UPI00196B4BD0|nr:hypothetical protein [Burkholderia cenocepacia]MBN3571365.1 hypothetical protein [Burkholderia cenocepacia]MBR8114261.1 hypothetical protein [Burkholderia cenocepacia]